MFYPGVASYGTGESLIITTAKINGLCFPYTFEKLKSTKPTIFAFLLVVSYYRGGHEEENQPSAILENSFSKTFNVIATLCFSNFWENINSSALASSSLGASF